MQRKGTILTYQQLVSIENGENDEQLVDLAKECPDIICQYEKFDMKPFVGDRIFVRSTVAKKLAQVQEYLGSVFEKYRLRMVYGYRHPQVQLDYFTRRKKALAGKYPDMSEDELISYTHNFIAVPDVAGHVTGGAVDLTITTPDGDIDMGTKIADFTDEELIQTYAKGVTPTQMENREWLLIMMRSQGFAPFYGEWWHFSYGDKEWACFYNHKKSLYSAVYFQSK